MNEVIVFRIFERFNGLPRILSGYSMLYHLHKKECRRLAGAIEITSVRPTEKVSGWAPLR